LGDGLAAASPRVVALIAKWSKEDLVPGLSDMDFRVVCDAQTTAEDWASIDWHVGRLHRQMVADHPEWNRINEHTAGAGVSLAEFDTIGFHHPEYAVWTTWWGQESWAEALQLRTLSRPLSPYDEQYHLGRFLAYYSPYIHGIDPPINLAEFEPKYALAEHGFAKRQVWAVFEQIDAHYETPEQTDTARLDDFEQLLFAGFTELLRPIARSVGGVELSHGLSPASLRRWLDERTADPLLELLENVRFARIRAGRYYFYLRAPAHFSAEQQLLQEQAWTRKLIQSTVKLLNALQVEGTTTEECFHNLGMALDDRQRAALRFLDNFAELPVDTATLREGYAKAIEQFPHYYRLLEACFQRVSEPALANSGQPTFGRIDRVDGPAPLSIPLPASPPITRVKSAAH
jgi:hypothetical protein